MRCPEETEETQYGERYVLKRNIQIWRQEEHVLVTDSTKNLFWFEVYRMKIEEG